MTSRHLRDRLYKETEKNLALKVEDTDSPDRLNVFGRGILHLSILIETMRREGYELQLGQPKVVIKMVDGFKHEPVELLYVNVDEEFSGKVIEIVTGRKGDILNIEKKDDRVNLEFKITARGLIGLRQPILTSTEGNAVISHRFSGYEPWKGELIRKRNGAMIAMETGTSIAYSIDKLQDRGKFHIEPMEKIYEGQVIGEHTKQDDLVVNITKTKKQTNMRASGSDEKVAIVPATKFSLEESLEYVGGDEYVEVTPKSIRLRKILLKEFERKREKK